MNLTISGHHLEVTPALRSYVTGKLIYLINNKYKCVIKQFTHHFF
jgi:ribosome-associated translation inhibitor RaiA